MYVDEKYNWSTELEVKRFVSIDIYMNSFSCPISSFCTTDKDFVYSKDITLSVSGFTVCWSWRSTLQDIVLSKESDLSGAKKDDTRMILTEMICQPGIKWQRGFVFVLTNFSVKRFYNLHWSLQCIFFVNWFQFRIFQNFIFGS